MQSWREFNAAQPPLVPHAIYKTTHASLVVLFSPQFNLSNATAPVVPDIPGAQSILYGRVIPACGVALFIGNVYYAWLATRLKSQFGRDFTANPYGINTVGCFPFLFNIMLPVAIKTGSIEAAWKAGCTGNFIVGLINIALGIAFSIPTIANAILAAVPIHALTIPVAGVGITWLAINQIAPCFGSPVAGFLPLTMIFFMYYARTPISIMGFKVPEVLHWIVPGFVLGWIYQLPPAAAPGWTYVHPGGGLWIGGAFVQGFADVGPLFGTVLPVAVVSTAAGIMSLVSAYNAGDPYPIGETLITDGLFTIIGSIFGSPFGTVIYFGQPIHKKLGGKAFFSFANGWIYLILTLSGLFPLILDITPKVAAGPTIFIFGLMLCEECTRCIPHRHHSVIFFALFFSWCDYFGNKGGAEAGEEGAGLDLMKNGYLLNSMFWSVILVYMIDCKFAYSAVACTVASGFAIVGLIHQPSIDFTKCAPAQRMQRATSVPRDAPRASMALPFLPW